MNTWRDENSYGQREKEQIKLQVQSLVPLPTNLPSLRDNLQHCFLKLFALGESSNQCIQST